MVNLQIVYIIVILLQVYLVKVYCQKNLFHESGIDLTNNQTVYFQAENKDGNIIATNFININRIGKLNPDLFYVEFEQGDSTTNGSIYFTPKLSGDTINNQIFCKISDPHFSGLIVGEGESIFDYFFNDSQEFSNFHNIGPNHTWWIDVNDKQIHNVNLTFIIKNRTTEEIMLTKSYDLMVSPRGQDSHVTGGVINPGQDDEQQMTPDNDTNLKNNIDLNIDWNSGNAVSTIKDFFNTAKDFFNLILNFLNQMPNWIIIPLYTLFMLAIIVFIFHVIRG